MAGLLEGVLPAIYSAGDTAKRRLGALLRDPAGTLGLGVARFGEDQQQMLNLANEAGYMPGSRSVLVGDKQRALARALLAQKATEAGAGMIGTFMGPGSKTWDAVANKKAAQMEAAGVDPRVIWKETGNWKGPDGRWRQEIDDSSSAFIDKGFGTLPSGVKSSKGSRLDKVLSHDELYAAYPGARKIDPAIMIGGDPALASSGSWKNGLLEARARNATEARSVGVHEIQHAIQHREGFAKGGNPDMMRMTGEEVINPEFVKGLNKWNKILAAEGYPKDKLFQPQDIKMNDPDKLWDWIQQQGGWLESKRGKYVPEFDEAFPSGISPMALDAHQAYLNLAGEAEARAVQSRLNMNAAQRRAKFPADSYDVPIDQLIVRGATGENALVRALRGSR